MSAAVAMKMAVVQEPPGWLSAVQQVAERAVDIVESPPLLVDRRVLFDVDRRAPAGAGDAVVVIRPSRTLFEWLTALWTVEAQSFIARFGHAIHPSTPIHNRQAEAGTRFKGGH